MPSQTTSLSPVVPTPSDRVAVRFHILADTSPGLLPRLLQPFAKRDLTPDAVHATREGETMRVEIVLDAMPADMVHLAAGNLGQVFGVQAVRTCHGGDAVLRAA